MLRPDAPLIRHISESAGLEYGRRWHALPYVLLPGEDFVRYLADHGTRWQEMQPTLDLLPWPDVTFDFVTGRRVILARTLDNLRRMELGETTIGVPVQVPDRGRCWIRVTEGELYMRRAATHSPWLRGDRDLLAPFRGSAVAWLAIESWEESTQRPDGTRGLPWYPDVSLVRKSDPWNALATAQLYPNPRCREGRIYGDGQNFCNFGRCRFPDDDARNTTCMHSELVMRMGVRLLLATLAYLEHGDEYLVEVTPPAPRKARSGESKKPWANPGPHWILIDPQRAREYGHPSGQDQGGSHASPHPHQRRGHWRVLRHERYERDMDGQPRQVYVKPMWVGQMEWQHEGQRYRVVPPRRGAYSSHP